MNPPRAALAIAALTPLSWVYGGLVRWRNRRFDRPGASLRAGVPVVSVGNLTWGGTGKTPLVAWLVGQLQRRGHQPAVVSRGYGGRAGRGPLWVSHGAGPVCAAADCGDEPYLLTRLLPGARIVVGADRVAVARAARDDGADVVVLDDGFQHRRLARDLDLVLVDATQPFGNGRLLPAGSLRESLAGLQRADAVVVTRAGADERFPSIENEVRQHNRAVPVMTAGHRVLGFLDALGQPRPAPSPAVVFSGIGNPETFLDDVRRQGVEVVGFHAFADHHPYDGNDWRRLRDEARGCGATLVTTEKDLVRLPRGAADEPGAPLVAMRIEAVLHDPDPLLDLLQRAVAGAAT